MKKKNYICRDCDSKKAASRYQEIREKRIICQKQYYKENKKMIDMYQRKYGEENKKELQLYRKKYWASPEGREKLANRRAIKQQHSRILTSGERKQIIAIFKKQENLNKISTFKWHVDHLIPLSKGGLHHPSNLQLVPAWFNLRKHDKLDLLFCAETFCNYVLIA